jgi:DNA-binding beta-propeller fold protein YncE
MTAVEDRLREALSTAASAVRKDTLRPLTVPERRPRRWLRLLAPVAAAAAVLLIVAVEAGIGRPAPPRRAAVVAPAVVNVPIGQVPTAAALDRAASTLYVAVGSLSAGASGGLAMVNVATCHSSRIRGCTRVGHVPTGGQVPTDVAVDEQTHTVYVANGPSSSTVTVLDAAACNAHTTRGCAKDRALVSVPRGPGVNSRSGPVTLAINPRTSTVYVTNYLSSVLSVIDGRTCNATNLSGCHTATAATQITNHAVFPALAVDPVTDTIYLSTWDDHLLVVDGRTCNAADVRGCGKVLATVPVDGTPTGFAVDQATGTLYVTSTDTSAVTIISTSTCNARDVAGCTRPLVTTRGGPGPLETASDQASRTFYVTGTASNTVAMINAAACSAARLGGCGRIPASFPAGSTPQEAAVDPGTHTLYLASAGTLSVVSTRTCNASDVRGCPAQSPAGTVSPNAGPYPGYVCGSEVVAGSCPTSGSAGQNPARACNRIVTNYESGLPAAPLIADSVRVATGTAGGLAWSLWAKQGTAGPFGIEQGGMVLDGNWYALCSVPRRAGSIVNLELIDTGARGVVYGFIQHPRQVTVMLSSAGQPLPPPAEAFLRGMTFFILRLPESACSYRAMTLRAQAAQGPAWSGSLSVTFGTCAAGRLVNTGQVTISGDVGMP